MSGNLEHKPDESSTLAATGPVQNAKKEKDFCAGRDLFKKLTPSSMTATIIGPAGQ